MENLLLVVHILTCIALIGVVLLQRSEGGALGIGGGGGGGLMSGRGAASSLSRVTMILAAVFFVTSLTLTTLATRGGNVDSSLAEEVERRDADELDLPTALDDEPAPAPTSDLDAPAPSDAPSSLDAAPDLDSVIESENDPLDAPADPEEAANQP